MFALSHIRARCVTQFGGKIGHYYVRAPLSTPRPVMDFLDNYLAEEEPRDWPTALDLTARLCTTYFHARSAHWIGIGSRIWAGQMGIAPIAGHTLADELMYAARREVALRVAFTQRMLGEVAERFTHEGTTQILVDCTRTASELLREGCRDVENDIVRTARFVPGIDVGALMKELSDGVRRVTTHLLAVCGEAHFDI